MTESRLDGDADPQAQRLLRLLKGGDCAIEPSSRRDRCVVRPSDGPPISVRIDTVKQLRSSGFAEITQSGCIRLAERAMKRPDRPAPGDCIGRGNERVLTETTVLDERGAYSAVVNIAESPLGLLSRRKDKAGRPFLTSDQFGAGERLRADFTRGQMLPRLGANWRSAVASGRRDGSRGSVADLTDAALGARERVENALTAVGPELSGVLVDVCCFLKGLEVVEMERQWPARSAKIVLKAALAALARHYRPHGSSGGRAPAQTIVHWGTSDYRPSLVADKR